MSSWPFPKGLNSYYKILRKGKRYVNRGKSGREMKAYLLGGELYLKMNLVKLNPTG